MMAASLLTFLLQSGVVLALGLAGGILAKRRAALRSAIYRVAIVSSFAIALAAPWLVRHPNPVVPVNFEPVATRPSVVKFDKATFPVSYQSPDLYTGSLADPQPNPVNPADLLATIYLLGVGTMLAFFVIGHIRLAFLRRKCSLVIDPQLLRELEDAANVSQTKQPKVVESNLVSSPFVAGIGRPTLYLPLRFADSVSEGTVRSVLRHEMAHLAEHDLVWRAGAQLLNALNWPNPLVWMLRRQAEQVSEQISDARVVQSGVRKQEYAGSLLDLAEIRTALLAPAIGLGAYRGTRLSARIQSVLNLDSGFGSLRFRSWVTLVAVATLMAGSSVLLFASPQADLASRQSEVQQKTLSLTRLKRVMLGVLLYAQYHRPSRYPTGQTTADIEAKIGMFVYGKTSMPVLGADNKLHMQKVNIGPEIFQSARPGGTFLFNMRLAGRDPSEFENPSQLPVWREDFHDLSKSFAVAYADGHVRIVDPKSHERVIVESGRAKVKEDWTSGH